MWPQVVHYLFEGALYGIKPRRVDSAVDFWFSRGVIITQIEKKVIVSVKYIILQISDSYFSL